MLMNTTVWVDAQTLLCFTISMICDSVTCRVTFRMLFVSSTGLSALV